MNDHTDCPACFAGHTSTPVVAVPLPDGSGYTTHRRTVVARQPEDEPLQFWHPDHGWGDVRALCPEQFKLPALVLVWFHDAPEHDGWIVLEAALLERAEFRPTSAMLALYGRADALARKSENMREQHERAQREQHERRLVFADSLLSARAHVERVQLALTALREQVEDCPTPDEAEAVTRAAGVLAGIADFLETITQ